MDYILLREMKSCFKRLALSTLIWTPILLGSGAMIPTYANLDKEFRETQQRKNELSNRFLNYCREIFDKHEFKGERHGYFFSLSKPGSHTDGNGVLIVNTGGYMLATSRSGVDTQINSFCGEGGVTGRPAIYFDSWMRPIKECWSAKYRKGNDECNESMWKIEGDKLILYTREDGRIRRQEIAKYVGTPDGGWLKHYRR